MPDTVILTRRQGLIAAAIAGPIALLAGCSPAGEPDPDPSGAGSAAGSASASPAEATAAEEADLIARYDAVLTSVPDLVPEATALLTLIRDQHAQHRDALGGSSAEPVGGSGPATLDVAITDLLAAERQAARSRVRACIAAGDPETARLLCLIAASEASHVPALKDLRP